MIEERQTADMPDTRKRAQELTPILPGANRENLLKAAETYLEDAATCLRGAAIKSGKVKGLTATEYAAVVEYLAARIGGLRKP